MNWRDGRHDGPSLQTMLAVAASMVLHMTIVVAMQPAPLPQEKRISERAIEVTLERAMAPPSASPSASAAAEVGSPHRRGSIDLVHTALAPGPPDAARLTQATRLLLAAAPVPLPAPLPQPRLEDSLTVPPAPPAVTARELALAAPSSAARSRDVLDHVQAPPTRQPERQASAHQPPRPKAAGPPAAPVSGEPARRSDTASYASRHQAQQDYVLQVVRKLSHMRFYVQAGPAPVAHGVVIARLTVARDGGLVDLSLAKDSGSPGVDSSVLDTIRKAAPFAPLPQDFTNGRFTFIVPINYAPEG